MAYLAETRAEGGALDSLAVNIEGSKIETLHLASESVAT